MTDDDKKRFMALLLPMSAVFGVEMPKDQVIGYWIALKPNLTIEEFEKAVGVALQTLKWMPKPVELIDLVKPSKALLAWDVFAKVARGYIRHSINFQDPIINAVARSLGGLTEISKVPSDKFYAFTRKDFLESYREFERDGLRDVDSGPLLIRGNHEGDGHLPGRGIACGYVNGGGRRLLAASANANREGK